MLVPKFRASQPVTQLMNFSFSETALASADKFRAVAIILLALEGLQLLRRFSLFSSFIFLISHDFQLPLWYKRPRLGGVTCDNALK